ncbi:MAG: hypothetical protein ACREJU_19220 [Nitrospiraceae bacterium]
MPIVTNIVCDGCGTVKKEVNHWYALTGNQQGAYLQPLDLALHACAGPEGSQVQYYCGRKCAVEAVMGWMDRLHCSHWLI